MKKLEKLKSQKFIVSEEDQMKINGGIHSEGTLTRTYAQVDTKLESGGWTCDTNQIDACIDW